MELMLGVLGGIGLLVAIAANTASISRYLDERRERREGRAARREATVEVPPRPQEAVAPAPAPASAKPAIRTPDQRVRVFVSSTLVELAEERDAVRAAVTALRLTPVMFEAGARAHPPRELYRAYLDQSDVFVGVYAARYGWVAPDETVSGLEDEYLRSGDRPKLIYVKRVDDAREPRLEALLERVRADDRVSYRPFKDAVELRDLVADDLATLLSERFDDGPGAAPAAAALPVPVLWGPLFGRERELERVRALWADRTVRLVTLLGPGGIGKSRLALELAHRARTTSGDAVAFVGLQAVTRAEAVPAAIAEALGLHPPDEGAALEALEAYLGPRRTLLVIDNFEQVMEAAALLARLLERAPDLRILVTSRAPLRLSAERCVPVGPLTVPPAEGDDPLAVARANAAVGLFVWRARAADPDFDLTPANAPLLLDLVRALEGWPLAVLLAGARAGHTSLEELRERLVRPLDTLVGGARDLPERQQTLRRTIAWSVDLLDPAARTLLRRMSVFVGGAGLDALQAVAGPLESGRSVLDALGDLVDHSLVLRVLTPSGARYVPYELVREAALELLEASGERAGVAERHAAWFVRLAIEAGPEAFRGGDHQLARLHLETDNLDAAIRRCLAVDDVDAVAQVARALWLVWWIQGRTDAQLPWIRDLLARDDLSASQRAALAVAAAAAHGPTGRRRARRGAGPARRRGRRLPGGRRRAGCHLGGDRARGGGRPRRRLRPDRDDRRERARTRGRTPVGVGRDVRRGHAGARGARPGRPGRGRVVGRGGRGFADPHGRQAVGGLGPPVPRCGAHARGAIRPRRS